MKWVNGSPTKDRIKVLEGLVTCLNNDKAYWLNECNKACEERNKVCSQRDKLRNQLDKFLRAYPNGTLADSTREMIENGVI